MNADTMPNTRNRQLKSPMLLPVINGEKPPIPVPLRRRFDTPYRYVDSNVLRSCSFDNLLTMSQYSILNLTNNGDSALKTPTSLNFQCKGTKKSGNISDYQKKLLSL